MNYFSKTENIEKFQLILNSWKGTPYQHLKAVKGRGADCTLFIGHSLLEANILTNLKYKYYAKDWFYQSHNQFLTQMFHKHWQESMAEGLKCVEYKYTEVSDLVFGDILTFNLQEGSPITNHAAVYVGDGEMLQSINYRVVGTIKFGNYFKNRISSFFRVEVL